MSENQQNTRLEQQQEKPSALRPVSPTVLEKARAGEPEAQFLIGECFSNGFAPFACPVCGGPVVPAEMKPETNVCPDCGARLPFEQAVAWYGRANLRHYDKACLRLCVSSFFGLGAPQDEAAAKHYYKWALLTRPALEWPPVAPFDEWARRGRGAHGSRQHRSAGTLLDKPLAQILILLLLITAIAVCGIYWTQMR
ncbi:MAG: hypothetical protein LBR07_09070 [Puniceicoccales bacterium]|jgi:hypothetical protein|nr:hypothetical protein [Puniceicoccales bacterium]